jgi:AcrR family transcriptional regulator
MLLTKWHVHMRTRMVSITRLWSSCAREWSTTKWQLGHISVNTPTTRARQASVYPVVDGREEASAMKETLLRHSARLFAVSGYHAAKISDIVRASGVTQATFYWHFQSKLDVALEVITRGRDQMLEVIQHGYRKQPVSIEGMLANTESWLLQLLDFANRNRHFMAILLTRLKGADVQIDQAIVETRSALFSALRNNIDQAVSTGMLPAGMDLDLRAAFVYRLIEGSIEWWLFGNAYQLDHVSSVPARRMAEQLARFEFFGLLAV